MSEPAIEIIEAEPSTELDVYEPPAPGLFGTSDPDQVLARAVKVADALERVIREKKLIAKIRQSEHVLVEGWTLLGSMLGVFPVLVWTRKLDDGWEARVEARTRAGEVVGAAESECLRSEARWAKAEDYAIRSMAATRATSKALRQPLGFVMTMAGFDATPVEEMPLSSDEPASTVTGKPADPAAASDSQLDELRTLIRTLEGADPDTDWKSYARKYAGVPQRALTKTGAVMLIEKLQDEVRTTMPKDEEIE
jgi:hypothetical protein